MKQWLKEFVLEGVLLALCIYLAIREPAFLNKGNLLDILHNVSMQGVIAFGMTMVIIAGEIDLSVGSMVAFSGCMIAWLTGHLSASPLNWAIPISVAAAIFATLILGILCGAISGILRVRFGVPTFISTLAWMASLRGIAGLLTNGFPLTTFPQWFFTLDSAYVLTIPLPAMILVVVFLLIQFVMNYTPFGRGVYAVGGNAEAARLSGIPVARIKIQVMAIVAALAVLAGMMQSAQLQQASDHFGLGWELDVIASVIIGGTSLMGGAGKVRGTLVGIIFLGVLSNGMTLLNTGDYWQMVVRGALILAAVLMNVSPGQRK